MKILREGSRFEATHSLGLRDLFSIFGLCPLIETLASIISIKDDPQEELLLKNVTAVRRSDMTKTKIRELSLIGFLIPLTILSFCSSLQFSNHAFGQSDSLYDSSVERCHDTGMTSEEDGSASDEEGSSIISAASAYASHRYDEYDSGVIYSSHAEGLPANRPIVSISTDLVKYIAGDMVFISGRAVDSLGCPLSQPVTLQVFRDAAMIYQSTILPNIPDYYYTYADGFFEDSGVNADKPGIYTVNATLNYINGTSYNAATTKFEVQEMFYTRPAFMLYVGLGFFGGLVFILLREIKHVALTETLRFICLTGIAFSIIAALLLTDVQIGTNAPVGLVKAVKPPEGDVNCEEADTDLSSTTPREWMINFGGQPPNYCHSGIAVPVNIVVFGIAGGYLRYLWDTARLREKMQEVMKKNGQSAITRTWLFYVSLHDLALFVLSPLLAIVVWFVLSESGATGLFTIAAISFTVGLVTEEIIQTLMRFTTSVLRSASSVGERIQDKTVELKEISNGNGNGNGNGKKETIEKKAQEAGSQNKDSQEKNPIDSVTVTP